MRELTPLGKYLRKVRIDRDETLSDMAERLSTSPSFLSAIETGRKNPPEHLARNLAALYGLPADQLNRLADEQRGRFEIWATTRQARHIAGVLEREFERLSPHQLGQIKAILGLPRT